MNFYVNRDELFWHFGIGDNNSQKFSINKNLNYVLKTSCFNDKTFDYLEFKFDYINKTISINILDFSCPKSFFIYFDIEIFNSLFALGNILTNFSYDVEISDKYVCLSFSDKAYASTYSLDDLVSQCNNLRTQYCLEL